MKLTAAVATLLFACVGAAAPALAEAAPGSLKSHTPWFALADASGALLAQLETAALGQTDARVEVVVRRCASKRVLARGTARAGGAVRLPLGSLPAGAYDVTARAIDASGFEISATTYPAVEVFSGLGTEVRLVMKRKIAGAPGTRVVGR